MLVNLGIWVFSKICQENWSLIKIPKRITCTLHKDVFTFITISRWLFLRMRNVSKINTRSVFSNLHSELVRLHARRHTPAPPVHTHTHTPHTQKYVRLIAVSRQQLFLKIASLLRYTYIELRYTYIELRYTYIELRYTYIELRYTYIELRYTYIESLVALL
jgi:hypothetical protein